MNKTNISIYIFTRDLRLQDNTSLIKACTESLYVIPIFIFNPEQLSDKNKYKSDRCVQFMCECLDELNMELEKVKSRLIYFYGSPKKIINEILEKYDKIKSVYINMDYTPFAKKRDSDICKVCDKHGVNFYSYEDYLLTGKDIVVNGNNNPYVKFTPFYNKATKIKVRIPNKKKYNNFVAKKIKFANEFTDDHHKFYEYHDDNAVVGGRSNALKILKGIANKNHDKYNEERDYLNKSTTSLSPYLKFNVVSVREVYDVIKTNLTSKNKLLVQLYWRDFYMIILNHYPQLLGSAMKEKFNNLEWNYDKNMFKKWCNGKTGFPLVDAGMRQLNQTGMMHNRCRMIVADFLIKLLCIDWKWGEKYFASKLIDYDPANNNGGWAWCGSLSHTSQDWYTCFNPFIQSKKYDNDCEYIKKWIPELKDVENKDIHAWDVKCDEYNTKYYPKPMVNYVVAKQNGLDMYKKIFK